VESGTQLNSVWLRNTKPLTLVALLASNWRRTCYPPPPTLLLAHFSPCSP
jgi:hypothetical protein